MSVIFAQQYPQSVDKLESMPVFDFTCTECHERTEYIVLAGEAPPTTCAACGGSLKRAYSGGRVHINLEGWGFSRNDGLIGEDRAPRKNWRELKERANQIRDER